MRLLPLIVAATLAPLAGCGSKACKDGTAFVNLKLGTAAQGADSVILTIVVDGVQKQQKALQLGGRSDGTVEIDFASYPRNSSLLVDVVASKAGTVIARGSATVTLSGTCAALQVDVASMFSADMASPDLTAMPVASIVPKPDYVGFTSKADGSGSSDPQAQALTFAWTLVTVPVGSTLGTGSLTGANTSMVSFFPDLGGTYTFSLTVTATDGRSTTTTADVVVPTWPVYFNQGTGDSTQSRSVPTVIRSDGTGEHSVACPMLVDAGWQDPSSGGRQLAVFNGAFGSRAWQPGVGVTGTSYYVFWDATGYVDLNSSTFQPPLFVGSDTTNCAGGTAPVRIDTGVLTGLLPLLPRPSPDGKRVAYIEANLSGSGNNYAIVTVAADGSGNIHRVRGSVNMQGVPPVWLDNTHLMWGEQVTIAPAQQLIVSADDANGAGTPGDARRTVLLTCDDTIVGHLTSSETIAQAVKTPFGLLISTTNKRLMNMQAGNCMVAAAQMIADESMVSYGGHAGDFDVSPDGQIYIMSGTMRWDADMGSQAIRRLFLGSTDGTSAPQPFGVRSDLDQVGAYFVTNGRQIVWSEIDTNNGAHSRVLIANLDGTQRKILRESRPVPGDLGDEIVFSGTNTANCSYGGMVGSGTVLAALAILLAALAVRTTRLRRKRQ